MVGAATSGRQLSVREQREMAVRFVLTSACCLDLMTWRQLIRRLQKNGTISGMAPWRQRILLTGRDGKCGGSARSAAGVFLNRSIPGPQLERETCSIALIVQPVRARQAESLLFAWRLERPIHLLKLRQQRCLEQEGLFRLHVGRVQKAPAFIGNMPANMIIEHWMF